MTASRRAPVATFRGVPITIVGPGLTVRYVGVVVDDARRMRQAGWSWELTRHTVLLWAHQWQPVAQRGERELETWIAMHQRLLDAIEGAAPSGVAP